MNPEALPVTGSLLLFLKKEILSVTQLGRLGCPETFPLRPEAAQVRWLQFSCRTWPSAPSATFCTGCSWRGSSCALFSNNEVVIAVGEEVPLQFLRRRSCKCSFCLQDPGHSHPGVETISFSQWRSSQLGAGKGAGLWEVLERGAPAAVPSSLVSALCSTVEWGFCRLLSVISHHWLLHFLIP